MQSKRNGEIDFLRFVFSMVVVFFHFNENYHFGFCSNGSIAVEFFFVVSGYLLASHVRSIHSRPETWSEIADSTWAFLLKKAGGFFHYYVCVFLLNLVIRCVLVRGADVLSLLMRLLKSIPTITLTFMGLNYRSAALYVGNTWYLSAMLIAMFMLYPLLVKSFDAATKLLFPLVSMFTLGYLYSAYGTVATWNKTAGIFSSGVLRAIAEIALGASLLHVSCLLARKFPRRDGGRHIVERLLLTACKIGCDLVGLLYACSISFGANFWLPAPLLYCVGIGP